MKKIPLYIGGMPSGRRGYGPMMRATIDHLILIKYADEHGLSVDEIINNKSITIECMRAYVKQYISK